ncbi:MAG: membrane integrity-associated transporter subunit PqiC [Proteobacteria bacterium]|uniref:Membrane integrity-associated transporter subunit PqiC n=1 Tax=Candidatus Avisuccinivibrio stercorigallinarum TaxID=2840704 RepID=A0A9D9DAY7_9GAMM|nr:membrane integrity-associated transporter subunit PqiC [Candidatus Avisuccinivibrio stercorigallinarum]
MSKTTNNVVKTSAALLLAAALLCACSSTVNFERYSLTQQSSALAKSNPFALRLNLSPELASGGIVMQTGPNTLVSAKEHRWAQPLENELATLLTQSLINTFGSVDAADGQNTVTTGLGKAQAALSPLKIDALVTTFQGDLKGLASIDFVVTVKDEKERVLLQQEYRGQYPLQDDGYGELCRVLQQGFMQLSTQFAQDLKTALLSAQSR